MKRWFALAGGALLGSLAILSGCSSSQETAQADALTRNVGNYGDPPAGIAVAKVGIPPFVVTEGDNAARNGSLDNLAADQMTTLAVLSKRFEVVERASLGQLVREQQLEGMVNPAELAKAGQIAGVDYLIYGKVTNLRIKAEKTGTGFNLGSIPIPFVSASAFDYQNTESRITADCGVDIRMVDPTTGKVAAAHFGEYKQTDSIGAFGISILGVGAGAEADLQIDENNKGKVLRLALDEALRKMLVQVDPLLVKLGQARRAAAPPAAPPAATTATATTAPATTAPTATAPTAAGPVCASCGKPIAADAKFCASCGAKVPEAAAKKVCSSCGKEIAADAKFCGACGAQVKQ